MRFRRRILILVAFILFLIDYKAIAQHDAILPLIEQAIQQGEFPGCVICFGDHKEASFLSAFGNRQIEPSLEPMTVDTIFDLASLTKPIATATSIMILLDQGQINLESRVIEYLPEFGLHGKDQITIKHLLIHQSGLIPDNPLSDYSGGPEEAWKKICELKLTATIGTKFQYSDVNFIVLGEVIRRVSGQPLDAFSRKHIFEPLGMDETGFNPSEAQRTRCAPTEKDGEVWLRGVVHDPRARKFNGVAGHAGLFSSARDLSKYAAFMLSALRSPQGTIGREPEDESAVQSSNPVPNQSAEARPQACATIIRREKLDLMTRAYKVSNGTRGLGWDKQSPYSSNRGSRLSPSAFGHGGFTGTVLWIDPELDFYFIFLSNRLHPDGKGSVNELSGKLIDLIVEARMSN